jgi:hypothetical protein
METGKMKKFWVVGIFLILAACSQKPEIVDNGQPGQIRVVVFQDDNRNGVKDSEETGLADRVGLGQGVSCPTQNIDEIMVVETDPSGEALYQGLKPGTYCVMYMGSAGVTTKLTVEVYLSSEQQAVVGFGLVGE